MLADAVTRKCIPQLDWGSATLTYNLANQCAGKEVEPKRRSGTFGRSCKVCKLYFLTSDPDGYICPWCQRAEKEVMLADFDYRPGRNMANTQILVQEEV